jgi:hypothetical protein
MPVAGLVAMGTRGNIWIAILVLYAGKMPDLVEVIDVFGRENIRAIYERTMIRDEVQTRADGNISAARMFDGGRCPQS